MLIIIIAVFVICVTFLYLSDFINFAPIEKKISIEKKNNQVF